MLRLMLLFYTGTGSWELQRPWYFLCQYNYKYDNLIYIYIYVYAGMERHFEEVLRGGLFVSTCTRYPVGRL
jgi:hypothetical protein